MHSYVKEWERYENIDKTGLFKDLLERKAKDAHWQGMSLLHLSALFGNDSLLKRCLSEDALNKPDTRAGRTPLTWAVLGNNPSTVALLVVELGCDVTIEDKYGRTAVSYCVINGWDNLTNLSQSLELLTVFCVEFLPQLSIYRTILAVTGKEVPEDSSNRPEIFGFGSATADDPLSVAVRTCNVKMVARLLLFNAAAATPLPVCPLIYYPDSQSSEVFTWMLLMFIAVEYQFTPDDAAEIARKMGDSAAVFSQYMEQGTICLEETGQNLEITPLKMVLDRNDRGDYKDVVELIMMGEVKTHFKEHLPSLGANIKEVLHCVHKNCKTSKMTSEAVSELTHLMDGGTPGEESSSCGVVAWAEEKAEAVQRKLGISPKMVELVVLVWELLLEFVVGTVLYYLDVASDIMLAVELYRDNEEDNFSNYRSEGTQVLLFTLVPQAGIALIQGVRYLWGRRLTRFSLVKAVLCFVGLGPLLVACECIFYTFKWFNEGHSIDHHQHGGSKKKHRPGEEGGEEAKPLKDVLDESVEKWNTIRIWEASLESGPELLLQFYIAFCTNTYSVLSLTLSFLSLVQAAAEYYYCKADGAISYFPHLSVLCLTTVLFLVSRLTAAFIFIFQFGVVILFPVAVLYIGIGVDIVMGWSKVKNKVLHVTTHLSSLFILVRSKFDRESTGRRIVFYMMMFIANGLLIIPCVIPPTIGEASDDCLCHETCNASGRVPDEDTLIYRMWGREPGKSKIFTRINPLIVAATFVIGVTIMLLYQHLLHPWRHIIATEPLFKHKDSPHTNLKYILGITLSVLFAAGDLACLCVVCLKAYPDSTLHGLIFFLFPYLSIAIALLLFIVGLSTGQNLNGLKVLSRPNCAVTGLICLFKVSGMQGAVVLGIAKMMRSGTSELDVAMAIYLVCLLCGAMVTVVLYQKSSLSAKFTQRGEVGWNGGDDRMFGPSAATLHRPPPPTYHHRHELEEVGPPAPDLPPRPSVRRKAPGVPPKRGSGRDTPAVEEEKERGGGRGRAGGRETPAVRGGVGKGKRRDTPPFIGEEGGKGRGNHPPPPHGKPPLQSGKPPPQSGKPPPQPGHHPTPPGHKAPPPGGNRPSKPRRR